MTELTAGSIALAVVRALQHKVSFFLARTILAWSRVLLFPLFPLIVFPITSFKQYSACKTAKVNFGSTGDTAQKAASPVELKILPMH